MEIGKEQKAIEVAPATIPVKRETPRPTEAPVETPEKVEARSF